jgi:hypothetical protein
MEEDEMEPVKQATPTVFWALVLIAAGLALLAETTGLIPSPSDGVVGAAFAVGGLVILTSHPVFHTHWWTLIAGPTILALGGVILLPGGWSGAIFLGGIGLGFVLVAWTDARRWWAIIPAGTLLTLASITLFSSAIGGRLSGVALFLGLAATFGVLAIIPRRHGRMRWPIYPAIGCLLFGLVITAGTSAAGVLWPLALVAAGVFLLIRASTTRRGPV